MCSRSHSTEPAYRKKLIEVDLPLDAINEEAGHGHPSILNWRASRPLAACRAVIFASLVDDPSSYLDDAVEIVSERQRLHGLIERLIARESSSDENLLAEARYEIARSLARSNGNAAPTEPSAVLDYLREQAQPVYDPFCGGGSIPLETQRLGLCAVGSDLNPVAVLITKALIELPPKFANCPPINPDADPMGMTVGKGKNAQRLPWRGAAGLAEDVRYYGHRLGEQASRRVGHLYPKARLSSGKNATVIAWLWARTVLCANPACRVRTPLLHSFQISKKQKNPHWIRPVVDLTTKTVSFEVQNHDGGVPLGGTVSGKGAVCVACQGMIPLSYVREQARAGNMSEQMIAVVAEVDRQRLFLSPTDEHIRAALNAEPSWRPVGRLPEKALGFRVQGYGFAHWHELFTERQLTTLTTFSDIVKEIRDILRDDGADVEYANAVCTYLTLAISKMTVGGCSFTRWRNDNNTAAAALSLPAIPMVWDFAEVNPFSRSASNWSYIVKRLANVILGLPLDANDAAVHQADASTTSYAKDGLVIITDPPYYDNIGYADLSDFFYVWLRPLLRDIYPDLFASMLTPKEEEMIASPFRFENPRQRFEDLLGQTLRLIREHCSDNFPSSIFYAYKQQEEGGWDTILTALIQAEFQIVGTWPIRTELQTRQRSLRANALASSVVLVCRPRPQNASVATRGQFLDALEGELPNALDHLTREGHIAPVDLAQAAIGPGMEIYSRYSRVETISGDRVTVREALAAINRVIAEYDEQQQGDLDSETRFCLDWLKQHGYGYGAYGEAETLAQAKNVSIDALRDFRRLLTAEAGVVRLLPLDEYGPDRQVGLGEMTAWEGCFRMAYHLTREDGGDIEGAASVAQAMAGRADSVESLARILYNYYDHKRESRSAVIFNNLVTSWPKILMRMNVPTQLTLQ